MPKNIVSILRGSVNSFPKPAVYISGGIDSTILLHHLREKTDEEIYTYTFGFPEDNEFMEARRVAEYYETRHKEILIGDMLSRFPEILILCDRPRFNLWVYWLAEQSYKDGRKTCYVGEGLDEHFGGYWNKPHLNYLECWADHYVWIMPTYQIVHKHFGLRLEAPFSNIDIRYTLPYWDEKREKTQLRNAYRGMIPDFVVNRKKRRGGVKWKALWDQELSKFFPHENPESDIEIRALLNKWVIAIWMLVNNSKQIDYLGKKESRVRSIQI